MPHNTRDRAQQLLMAALLGLGHFALAQTPSAQEAGGPPSEAQPWHYKLSASHYNTHTQTAAQDINLRGSHQDTTWWLAHYRRASEFEQTRAGWEQNRPFAWGRLNTSLQLATHGFAGGAVTAQLGSESIYALVGWGRTNLKDYYNLNFDPNDAITLGLGGKLAGSSTFALFTVKDDRLHTGQQISHAVLHIPLQDQSRLNLDYAYKRGRASAQDPMVQGKSLAVGLDHKDVFMRVAVDPKVNFSAYKQTRVVIGLRF